MLSWRGCGTGEDALEGKLSWVGFGGRLGNDWGVINERLWCRGGVGDVEGLADQVAEFLDGEGDFARSGRGGHGAKESGGDKKAQSQTISEGSTRFSNPPLDL